MISVGINGVCGRMGRTILAVALDDPKLKVAAGLEGARHPDIGKDLGTLVGRAKCGIAVGNEIDVPLDVLLDFSSPAATMERLKTCARKKIAMVIGTTGLSAAQIKAVRAAARKTPIVFAPNMAVGVNVMFALVRNAAGLLGGGYDAEIVEAHHRFKKDAPSGTAKNLVEMIKKGRGDAGAKIVFGREGMTGERGAGEIGVHSIRAGDIVGEHTTIFSTLGETLEITHRAHGREGFARGAILAAKFAAGKKTGLYTMADVLGLKNP
jgi:4-hydroxy-tetrahydrodipicolinate reductase